MKLKLDEGQTLLKTKQFNLMNFVSGFSVKKNRFSLFSLDCH